MTEAAMVHSFSHEEDSDDVGCNADLYAFKQDALQVVAIVSLQQMSDPYRFQPLSLD